MFWTIVFALIFFYWILPILLQILAYLLTSEWFWGLMYYAVIGVVGIAVILILLNW